MALPLTSGLLARIEAASRALVSPLAAPDVETWQSEVNAQIGALLGGEQTLFRLPTGDGSHFTTDGHDVVRGLMAYAQQVTPEMITYWDEAPNVWHTDRRTLGLESFTWDTVSEVVRRRGLDVDRAPVWNEVFYANRVRDYAGLITTRPEGDAILWSLGPRLADGDRERQRALLGLLVPSFKAGLDALSRLGAHRAALDATAEPLVAFDADGREVHRTRAAADLLAPDAARERVEGVLRLVGRSLASLARGSAGAGAPVAREVRTPRGTYRLRGALAAPGAFGPHGAALVSVAFQQAPRPAARRTRPGLLQPV